jgi:hypothetical protein
VVSPPSRRLGWGRVAESSLWLGLVVVVLVVVVRLVGCCLVGACGSAAALFLLLSAWPLTVRLFTQRTRKCELPGVRFPRKNLNSFSPLFLWWWRRNRHRGDGDGTVPISEPLTPPELS